MINNVIFVCFNQERKFEIMPIESIRAFGNIFAYPIHVIIKFPIVI